MKKTIITLLILFSTLFCLKANAVSIVVDNSLYNTTVQANGVSRAFIMRIDEGGQYDVVFKPLSDELTGSNGVNIPISYMYINNNSEDLYMRYQEETFLYRNQSFIDNDTKVLTAKILNYGMVPAGNYSISMQFTVYEANTEIQVATGVYEMMFIVPVTQTITFGAGQPTINVINENAFRTSGKVSTTTTPLITIHSNCDWELLADGTEMGDTVGNYYIKVSGASSGVLEKLVSDTKLNDVSSIVIARGRGPANGETLTMKYSVESKDGKFLKAGQYNNAIKYTLREYGGY